MNRNFYADRPNQKWVTDISYIPTKQGTLYLSVIRDLFDLSIVAYKTSTRQSIKLVLDTIRMAIEKEEVTAELLLHSDQGFQYASQSYFALTTQYGITPSMSRRANPYDNAMAENFFSILKSECIRLFKTETIREAQTLIDSYIAFYNHERIQLYSKLSPFQKRRLFVESFFILSMVVLFLSFSSGTVHSPVVMAYSCSRPLRRGLRALRMSIIGRRSSSAIPGTASSISRAGCGSTSASSAKPRARSGCT